MPEDVKSRAAEAFESAVAGSLKFVPRQAALLLAVSGGADSCAMLAAVARLRDGFGYFLHCAHVLHGIRPPAEGEADVVAIKTICERFSIPFSVLAVPAGAVAERARTTGKGLEDSARYFRRRALLGEAERLGAERILIGHTKDDLLETTLMRFLRGVGPSGLAAIPMEKGLILRPLLRLSRGDVLAYNEALGIAFHEDSTNADTRYTRNRIRRHLIPLLNRDFPGWKTAVEALATTQASVARYLCAQAGGQIIWRSSKKGGAVLETDAALFYAADTVIRAEAVYQAVDAVLRAASVQTNDVSPDALVPAEREPTRKAVESFASGAVNAQNLGSTRVFRREGAVVVESLIRKDAERSASFLLTEQGRFVLAGLDFCVEGKVSDKSVSIVLPLIIRTPQNFERSRLRSSFPSLRSGADVRFIVEDRFGFAAVLFEADDGHVKLLSEMRKSRTTGYAETVFFSIL